MFLEECLEFSGPLTTYMVPAPKAREKAVSAVKSPLPTYVDAPFFGGGGGGGTTQTLNRYWRNDLNFGAASQQEAEMVNINVQSS